MDRASIATLLTEALAIEAATAALIGRIVSIAFTALVLLVVYRVLIGVIERLIRRAPRARTLGSLLVNVTRWVFGFVILVIVLRELGIDPTLATVHACFPELMTFEVRSRGILSVETKRCNAITTMLAGLASLSLPSAAGSWAACPAACSATRGG